MKKVIALLTILLLGLPTFASSWVQVSDYDFIDKDSISYYKDDYGNTQYNIRSCWMKRLNDDGIYKKVEEVLNEKISYTTTLTLFDFERNMIVSKSIINYNKDNVAVHSYTYKPFEMNWDYISPDSKAEYWSYLVKHPKFLKKLYKEQMIQKQ